MVKLSKCNKKVTKITKEQAKQWFDLIDKIDEFYHEAMDKLEREIQDAYDKNLMFVWVDGNIVGIGSEDRKMKLIHRG